jgi:competence protein ComEC
MKIKFPTKQIYKAESFLFLSVINALIFQNIKLISFLILLTILILYFWQKKIIILLILLIYFTSSYGYFIIYPYENKKTLNKTVSTFLIADKKYQSGTIIFGKSKKINKYKYKLTHKYFSFKMPLISNILKFRNNFTEKIFNLSGGNITLPQALLLGNKSYLSNDFKDKFTVMGINHFLAVSGMHVGLILLFLYNIFFFFPQKVRKIFVSFLILILIPLAGFKIPVIRAVTFAFILMTASILDTKADLKKLLLFLAGMFLLISPQAITQPSFLLSFSAVFGILHFLEKKYNMIFSILLTGIVATVFTLPFVAYFFGTYNILSVLNTLIFLPLVYFGLCLSVFSLAFTQTSIEPLIIFEKIFHKTTDLFYKISFDLFTLNQLSTLSILILIIIILTALYFKKVLLLIPLLILPYIQFNHQKVIYIPSFKRAKAIIQTGTTTKIYYLGNYSTFRYKLIPFLAKININKFDEGTLKIFGGKNYFLKIKEKLTKFENLCINESNRQCPFVLYTKSNRINKFNIDNEKIYIIYKNRYKSKNIYELKKYKNIKIINGKIFYENNSE